MDKKTRRDFEFLDGCKNDFDGYITAICTYKYLKATLYSILPGTILGVIIGIIVSLVEGFSYLSILIPLMTIVAFPGFMLVGRPVYGFIFGILFCWIGYPIYKLIYNSIKIRNEAYKQKIISEARNKEIKKEKNISEDRKKEQDLDEKIKYFQNHEHVELFANYVMPELLSVLKSTERPSYVDTIPVSIVFFFYNDMIDFTINDYWYSSSGKPYTKDLSRRILFEAERIANFPNEMMQLAFGITLVNKVKEIIDANKDSLQKENTLDYDYTIDVKYGPKKTDYFDKKYFIIKLDYVGKNKNYESAKGW